MAANDATTAATIAPTSALEIGGGDNVGCADGDDDGRDVGLCVGLSVVGVAVGESEGGVGANVPGYMLSSNTTPPRSWAKVEPTEKHVEYWTVFTS